MNTKTKQLVYIFFFTVLGVQIGFLAHALVEIWYIRHLVEDFQAFSLGLSFENWFLIHEAWAVFTFFAGGILGFWQGNYWWKQIYVLKHFRNRS